MAEAVGNEVISLERVRLGPLELGGLRRGEARRLTEEELLRLWEDARP
jgi:16S rRNA U516 pseudouridylate synthase RsuA-like enzyme